MAPDTDTLVIGASAAGLATAASLKRARHRRRDPRGDRRRGHRLAPPLRPSPPAHPEVQLVTAGPADALLVAPLPVARPGRPVPREVPRGERPVAALRPAVRRARAPGRQLGRHDGRSRMVARATSWSPRGRRACPYDPSWPGMDDYTRHRPPLERVRQRRAVARPIGRSSSASATPPASRRSTSSSTAPTRTCRSGRPSTSCRATCSGSCRCCSSGILMRHLPPALADALGAPLVRLTVGDITEVGLRKLPYGPNTQIAQDHHIPLLDIGTMDHIRQRPHRGARRHRAVHRDRRRVRRRHRSSTSTPSCSRRATGRGCPTSCPSGPPVCDDDGRPLVSGGPTALPGLYFCGMFVAPSGMLREAGIEAQRIARLIADD